VVRGAGGDTFKSDLFLPASVTAVSFDLFGTLVSVERPDDPAAAVATELRERGADVPEGFGDAYRTTHIDAPAGAEVPLPAHISAALRACGGTLPEGNVARRAAVAAFDPHPETLPGAVEGVAAARERGPVGVLSNCSVPEVAFRARLRSDIPRDAFDAVVTSVACGWRKPDERAFEAVARQLDVTLDELVHVGDDPETDGAIEALGGRFVDVNETPLDELPEVLAAWD
jgi:FMN phosphatase YigB (HAD superfamily)